MSFYSISDVRKSWGSEWASAPDSEVFDAYVKASGLNREYAANALGYHQNVSTSYPAKQPSENIGAAMIGALGISILAVMVGVVITRMVRGRKKLTNSAAHTGIKWATYSILPTVFLSTHQFIQKGFIDGLVALLVTLAVYPAVAYFLGYVFRFVRPAASVSPLSVEGPEVSKNIDKGHSVAASSVPKKIIPAEEFWSAASAEFDGPDRRTGLWARVFSESQGNQPLAQANYLRHRADELQHQNTALLEQVRLKAERAERAVTHAQPLEQQR